MDCTYTMMLDFCTISYQVYWKWKFCPWFAEKKGRLPSKGWTHVFIMEFRIFRIIDQVKANVHG